MRSILAVAQDASPSRGFEALASISGESVRLMIGNGNPFPYPESAIREAVANVDVILIGMSSSEELALPELVAAREAIALGKPLVCFGDTTGCFNRKWFASIAPYVAVYFGASLDDAEAAKKVFIKAQCHGFGNPLDEQMVFSRFTREEVRKRLGVANDEIMVLAPGTKTLEENCLMWGLTIDVLGRIHLHGQQCKLVLALHPGDRSAAARDEKGNPLGLYGEFIKRSPLPVSILDRGVFSSAEALIGADLVVAFGGSIGREAGFKRIPILSLSTEIAHQRMLQETGHRIPESVKLGLAALVSLDGFQAVQTAIELLDPDSEVRKLMLQRQEAYYVPPPHRGYAAENMWQVLTDLA